MKSIFTVIILSLSFVAKASSCDNTKYVQKNICSNLKELALIGLKKAGVTSKINGFVCEDRSSDMSFSRLNVNFKTDRGDDISFITSRSQEFKGIWSLKYSEKVDSEGHVYEKNCLVELGPLFLQPSLVNKSVHDFIIYEFPFGNYDAGRFYFKTNRLFLNVNITQDEQ